MTVDPHPLPSPPPARFKVVRFRISKGDVAFEETIGLFSTESQAQAVREARLREASSSPRWPDFDDFAVFPLKP